MDEQQLPAPLVPADADLRDFAHMQLDVARLRDSELVSSYTPEACWAALLLWCASWHQVPAASIPDDDRWIAKQAGYVSRGRIDPVWTEIREGALHGWVKCSDGRLYHPVVSEKAAAAWESKLRHHYERARDRLRKENKKRAAEGQQSLPELTFESWNAQRLSAGVPMEKADAHPAIPPVPPEVPPTPATVPPEAAGIPPENALKGEGEGEGELDRDDDESAGAKTPVDNSPKPDPGNFKDPECPKTVGQWAAFFADEQSCEPDVWDDKFRQLAGQWVNDGVSLGRMRQACAQARALATKPISCLPSYAATVLATLDAPLKLPKAADAPAQQPRQADNVRHITVPSKDADKTQQMLKDYAITPELKAPKPDRAAELRAMKQQVAARAVAGAAA